MPTLQLNPSNTDTMALDEGSSQWLSVIERNSDKQRPSAVPKRYFDVLLAWG